MPVFAKKADGASDLQLATGTATHMGEVASILGTGGREEGLEENNAEE